MNYVHYQAWKSPLLIKIVMLGSTLLATMAIDAVAAPKAMTETPRKELTNPTIYQEFDTNSNNDKHSISSPITSVSQLSDVHLSDWAFQALQSLIERYGCDRGHRFEKSPQGHLHIITRYEFAAGLKVCGSYIMAEQAKFVTQEDLATIKKLQAEFAVELATLGDRIDAINAPTTELKANQFSTTTKLYGEAIFAITNAFKGSVDGSNTVFQDRVRLKFQTSFTGKDFLNARLDAGNTTSLKLPNYTSEGVQTFNLSPESNKVYIGWLSYYFPIGKHIDAYVGGVNGVLFDFVPTLSPFFDNATGGSGALTEFASSSPIYRIGGGAGVGINYKFSHQMVLSLGYLAGNHANAGVGNGLFNGQYSAIAQLVWNPNSKSGIGLTYVNAYQNRGAIFDLGGGVAIVGTDQANTPFSRMMTNSYGLEAFYQFSPQFAINGYFGYTNAKNLAGSGSADIWYYALELAFPDLGKKGNLGGIIVGAEPYRGNNPAPANDLSLHIEGFYKYQLTEHIAITPGIIWITAPGQNSDNSAAVIGSMSIDSLN